MSTPNNPTYPHPYYESRNARCRRELYGERSLVPSLMALQIAFQMAWNQTEQQMDFYRLQALCILRLSSPRKPVSEGTTELGIWFLISRGV